MFFWFTRCRWPNGTVTPYNQGYTQTCTGREKLADTAASGGFELERQLQFVSDAVLAFAYAVRDMHQELCQGNPGLCRKMKPIEGSQLLSYLKRVRFNGEPRANYKNDDNNDSNYYIGVRGESSKWNHLHFISLNIIIIEFGDPSNYCLSKRSLKPL